MYFKYLSHLFICLRLLAEIIREHCIDELVILIVFVADNLAHIASHGANIPCQNLVQILIILALDNQALANRKRINLFFLKHINMLIAAFANFPRDCQVIAALGARSDERVAHVHVFEVGHGFLVSNVLKLRMSDNSLCVGLTMLFLALFFVNFELILMLHVIIIIIIFLGPKLVLRISQITCFGCQLDAESGGIDAHNTRMYNHALLDSFVGIINLYKIIVIFLLNILRIVKSMIFLIFLTVSI